MIDADGRVNREWFYALSDGERNALGFKKNHGEEYIIINNYINDESYSFREKVYCYFNRIASRPKCPICGKELSFRRTREGGYMKYCSLRCVGKSSEVAERRMNTSIDRYGVPHFNNHEKSIQTCLEKYGVDNISKLDEVKFKRDQTNIERYGYRCSLNNPEVRKKSIETSRERYGVDYSLSINAAKYHDKSTRSRLNNLIESRSDIIGYTDDWKRWVMACPHPECNRCQKKQYEIDPGMYYDRMRVNAEVCTNLMPPGRYPGTGTTIELFIRNILDEYGIEYQCNVRNIIPPKELDIYIPGKMIAIECNGIYWHSGVDKRYHMDKWRACKDKGIQLITIWEDQIRNTPDIVRSIILNKIGIHDDIIYARKCKIVEIDSRQCSEFLAGNHLQGKVHSQVRVGLKSDDELVAAMTFSRRNGDEWELTRFCVRQGLSCPGAASRMIKYFIGNRHPSKIISYSCNDISDGHIYDVLGFTPDDKSVPSYWYIDPKTMRRYHRSSFSRKKLIGMGYDMKNMTEDKAMAVSGYIKIWDSGHIRWELNC